MEEPAKNRLIGRTQNGNGLRSRDHILVVTLTQMRPGVKHHPTVTENGHTEQGNLLAALDGGRYVEQVTNRMPSGEKIAQEANASSNSEDTLTWARTIGL